VTYIKEPGFWVAVIVVAVAVNWIWQMVSGKGKLV
jgi:hypothetical protein